MSTTVPSQPGLATTSSRGLMSAADKVKVDAITGANTGDVTLTAVGAAPNANGASLSGQVLTLQPASAAHPGVVLPGAQDLGTAKTISGAILNGVTTIAEAVTSLVRAAAATLVLRSSLGAGASDVITKLGTSITNGTLTDGAALAWLGAGIGGTEVKAFGFHKGGVQTGTSTTPVLTLNDVIGAQIKYGTGAEMTCALNSTTSASLGIAQMRSALLGAADVLTRVGANGVPNDEATLLGVGHGFLGTNVYAARVRTTGRLDQSGTDSSASPGAATINKPTGKSAIAAGASSVVITNSLVAATSRVMITPHARDATCKELIAVPAAGSFTVSGNANATAALAFSWEVSTIL